MSLYAKTQRSNATFSGDVQFESDAQEAHIADADTSHSAATTTELDALGTKINAILAVLEARGLTADS